mgnify:CR=1 FL=1
MIVSSLSNTIWSNFGVLFFLVKEQPIMRTYSTGFT